MNRLYESMQRQPQNDMMAQYQQFRQNPAKFLSIPPQFQNDPRGAIQNMLNSGQMSQNTYNRLYQMAQAMGAKF